MALQWHPGLSMSLFLDRHSNESTDEVKQAEIKFKDINEAYLKLLFRYAVLSDADKRRRYDAGQDLETLDHDE